MAKGLAQQLFKCLLSLPASNFSDSLARAKAAPKNRILIMATIEEATVPTIKDDAVDEKKIMLVLLCGAVVAVSAVVGAAAGTGPMSVNSLTAVLSKEVGLGWPCWLLCAE